MLWVQARVPFLWPRHSSVLTGSVLGGAARCVERMATGDIAGNTEALRGELSSIRYSQQLNSVRAQAGDPTELLPILSYALLRFSRHVALLVAEHGYQVGALASAPPACLVAWVCPR